MALSTYLNICKILIINFICNKINLFTLTLTLEPPEGHFDLNCVNISTYMTCSRRHVKIHWSIKDVMVTWSQGCAIRKINKKSF